MSDIVERIDGYCSSEDESNELLRISKAEILRLRAENEKLQAALKPFAEQYDAVEKEFGLLMLPDDANSIVRYADLRAAAAALQETGDE